MVGGWDGHEPHDRGFIYPLQGFPIEGGMTIPCTATLTLAHVWHILIYFTDFRDGPSGWILLKTGPLKDSGVAKQH